MSSARVEPATSPPGIRPCPAPPGPRARHVLRGARRRLAALLLAVTLGPAQARADEPPVAPPPALPGATAPQPAPEPAPAAGTAPRPAPADPLLIGTYPLDGTSVVDGDTLRVPGEPSIRILALDCEEVFHAPKDRRAAEEDFDAYARAKRAGDTHPVKFGTPAGEAARVFVAGLLQGATRVRLERDDVAGRDHDGFGRRLAHVLVVTPAGTRNLALEVIRAGHSPYFVKYGRARRFHADFVAAEAEARAAQRGIWGADGPRHYPDYDERLAWWAARAEQVERWRAAPDAPERIELGTRAADERLAQRVGQPVRVFGSLGRTRTDGWPRLAYLTHAQDADVPLVVRSEDVWRALAPALESKRYLEVRGTLSLYRGRPQIEVTEAAQVSIP